MEAVKRYQCGKTTVPVVLSEGLDASAWQAAAWTDAFMDIRGGDFPTPRFETRAKMLWDDEFFYIGARMEEPDIWGTLTEKNAIIYQDNDFEVFIDPDGDCENYYEFEVNALGTIWELTLDKPYKDGGQPTLGTNLDGLKSQVFLRGPINDPSVTNEGWDVIIAFPWSGLATYQSKGACPPIDGDVWKVNFSRVQWQHKVVDGQYERIPVHGTEIPWTEHPEDNWVWSPQGEINMHIPEMWGEVQFVAESSGLQA